MNGTESGTMTYTIRPLKNGECDVRDYITFQDGGEETRRFHLYVWLIEGGQNPMLVDTGVSGIESFNAGVARYIPGGVRQRPEERTQALLESAGIRPEEVSHVFVTHFHADHCDSFPLFPNAKLVAHRDGFDPANLPPAIASELRKRPGALQLVGDDEPLPGIHTFHLGVHSPCSMGIAVETALGRAVLPGDLVYLYANLEPEEYPPGWTDTEAWFKAIRKIRSNGDIVLPSHDPEVMTRWRSQHFDGSA